MDFKEATELMNLKKGFSLIELKTSYRQLAKIYHPDTGGSHEKFLRLTSAYDILFSSANTKGWDDYTSQFLPEWKEEFRKLWKEAYHKSKKAEKYGGLHYSTCIENFRRARITPLKEWFEGCLFDFDASEVTKARYRKHLLKVAPNQLMKESWAKKYYEREFKTHWIFYLAPAKPLIGK